MHFSSPTVSPEPERELWAKLPGCPTKGGRVGDSVPGAHALGEPPSLGVTACGWCEQSTPSTVFDSEIVDHIQSPRQQALLPPK